MKRFDVNEGDRLADMVARAERGEPVEITCDGAVVAELRARAEPPVAVKRIDLAAIERMRAGSQLWDDDPVALIREMRDGRAW